MLDIIITIQLKMRLKTIVFHVVSMAVFLRNCHNYYHKLTNILGSNSIKISIQIIGGKPMSTRDSRAKKTRGNGESEKIQISSHKT